MSTNTIHTFTDAQGVKWYQFAGECLHPDTSLDAGVVAFEADIAPIADGKGMSGYSFVPLEEIGKDSQVCVPADRCEIVAEHVEATVMDALQALVASGGKPVEGWKFCEVGDSGKNRTLCGIVTDSENYPFVTESTQSHHAYRPVTRVRVKSEVKPEPKFKVGDLVEVQGGDGVLQGLLANSDLRSVSIPSYANDAVRLADALLAELEKKGNSNG